MRFLSISLLTALLFSYGMTHSYAQDAQQETVQEQTVAAEQPTVTGETGETAQSDKAAENTESEPPKAAPVKKQNAFSRASDKQIAEAQRMESAADQGSSIDASSTNNSSGSMGGSPQKMADVYDTEFANLYSMA